MGYIICRYLCKMKCGAPRSKISNNFKTAMAEHETKHGAPWTVPVASHEANSASEALRQVRSSYHLPAAQK